MAGCDSLKLSLNVKLYTHIIAVPDRMLECVCVCEFVCNSYSNIALSSNLLLTAKSNIKNLFSWVFISPFLIYKSNNVFYSMDNIYVVIYLYNHLQILLEN